VRQQKAWVYVAARYQAEFLKLAEAKPVDSGSNLVVLNPNDDGVFYLQEGNVGEFVSTNPIQTYLDLSKAGGRGEEAAESILELKLKLAWRRVGWPSSP
jgi:hypothetical protein